MLDRAVTLGVQGSQSKAHGDRGIARYLVSQALALAKLSPRSIEAFDLDPDLPEPATLAELQAAGSVRRGEAPDPERRGLYHVMSPFEDCTRLERIWPPWAQAHGVKLAVTLYDLIPLRFPQAYLTQPYYRTWYHGRLELIRQADVVLAISEQTARDAVDLLGVSAGRVQVVLAGCSDFFRPRRPGEAMALGEELSNVRRGFIFYTAGIDWRKNIEGLMEGYARLPEKLRRERQLVVTCKVWPDARAALEGRARQLGIEQDFVLTGWVPDEILRELYWTCGLFVFPSRFEGFGLPLVEALRCGAPVIASDRSSLPEIVTDPRDRFDPDKPEEIGRALERALADRELRERQLAGFRAEEFTWERVAEKTLAAYERCLLPKPSRAQPAKRPRLALVSPMPPQATGVADYSSRLSRGLVRHADIDVIVEGPTWRYETPDDPRIRLVSHVGFEARHRCEPYDQILYCIGNSEFHSYLWPLMERTPGDALCHDVRLSGFFWCLGLHLGDDLLLGRLVRQYHLELLGLDERQPDRRIESWALINRPIYLVRELQRRARRLFVHSEGAKRLALGDGAQRVEVVPFGFPETRPAPLFQGPPVVTSFGVVATTKGSDLLVEAFGHLARLVPQARLVLAGPITADYRAHLEALVDRLALQGRVEIPGRLSDADYWARVRQTTLAVQLRTGTNGESSAALADCLAAGLPTLVTDIGSFAELPLEVVARAPLGISAGRLASIVDALLADGDRQERLRLHALAYAGQHSFHRVADVLWRRLRANAERTVAAPGGRERRHAVGTPPGP